MLRDPHTVQEWEILMENSLPAWFIMHWKGYLKTARSAKSNCSILGVR